MSADGKFWIWWWAIITVGVVTLAVACCAIVTCHAERMAHLGYEERQCVGSTSTIWVHVGDRL